MLFFMVFLISISFSNVANALDGFPEKIKCVSFGDSFESPHETMTLNKINNQKYIFHLWNKKVGSDFSEAYTLRPSKFIDGYYISAFISNSSGVVKKAIFIIIGNKNKKEHRGIVVFGDGDEELTPLKCKITD